MTSSAALPCVFVVCCLLACAPAGTQVKDDFPGGELRRSTQLQLERVDAELAQQKWQDALALLDGVPADDLNPYERSLLGVKRADVYVSTKQYELAAGALAKTVDPRAMPEVQHRSTAYRLLELYLALHRYEDAVALVERHALGTKGASAEQSYQVALAYAGAKRTRDGLPFAEAAVRDAQPSAEQKSYRLRLAASYEELGRSEDALRVLRSAHDEGMLTEETELLALIDLAFRQGAEAQAGAWLEQHMREGKIASTPVNQLRLARCWLAADDVERAPAAVALLDQDVVPGEVFFELGKLYVRRSEWSKAREPLALSLGRNVEAPGEVYLLLGIAHHHLNDKASALQALGKSASSQGKSAACAQEWLAIARSGRSGKDPTCAAELARGR